MQIIEPIAVARPDGAAIAFMDAGNTSSVLPSNMIRTMAQSPHALDGYLQLQRALDGGKLDAKLRERIALAVAQVNDCEYSLAQHTVLATQAGLPEEEIIACRDGRGADRRTSAALTFARSLARTGDGQAAELSYAGFDTQEIVEIVANVSLNIFANCLNNVAMTEVNFPTIDRKVKAA
jgi:AhpD family alkylhydroperoxidase